MSLSRFAVEHKPIVTTMVAILMGWGVMSYLTMPRREDPEFIIRTCQVLTEWPGTPTEQVEELITAPLEEEINQLDGIRWVKSETTVGRSAVFVELDRPTPGDEVEQMWDKVRSRVDRVRMPEPGIVPYVIDDFGDTNILLVALYQTPLDGEDEVRPENAYSSRELEIFAERLKDDLKLLPGASKVTVDGARSEAIYIETDLGLWTQLGLSTTDLEELLAARNVIAPGGVIDTEAGRFYVKPSGDIDAERELDSIVVGTLGDETARAPVYLDDLGLTVVRDYEDPPRTITRYGGPDGLRPCLLVALTMRGGANIVDVCSAGRAILEKLVEVDKVFPPDIGLALVSDQSENVERKIKDFMSNVVGAIAIVIAVVFLMVGFRSAAVMAANIPLVIIGSIAIITLFDIQLEQMSLAAMIIALGMLVDNAVQVCDQARRLQSEGMSPMEAARKGAEELSFPMLIATGTTVAAFYPMVIGLKGAGKEYIYSMPVTISVTLILSWFMAMTFCVMLAAWFIRLPKNPNAPASPVVAIIGKIRGKTYDEPPGDSLFMRAFAKFVRLAIDARWIVILVSFGLLLVATRLPVGSEFFPKDARDQFTIDIWLPEGASIQQTSSVTAEVEEILFALSPSTDETGAPIDRLRAMASVIGKGAPRWYLGRTPEAPKPYFAELVVRTSDGALTAGYVADLKRVLDEGDPELGLGPVTGARVIPRELMLGPVVDAPIGVRIFGPRLGSGFADRNIMVEQARKLQDLFRAEPGTWDIYDTWGSPSYQLRVEVDEDKANLAGVSNIGLAQTLNAFFSGHYLTTFREQDHTVPVYLRLPEEQRGAIGGLRAAYVEGANGKVPLDAVASLESTWDPAKIERRFLQRVIEVRARVKDGYRANDILANVLAGDGFAQWANELPPGYWYEIGGERFESDQAGSEMKVALVISILAIILLLIIQYNGIGKPIIILATLPLALIGALPGLYFSGNALGFMPQLGLLSLIGIVVNTAIIFIEFAEGLIRERSAASDGSGPIVGLTKREFRDCLVEACKVRLLPIAMTTLTTVGGLLPLAIAGGPLWEGMSWLMISGLMVATLLTLIVVPSLYAIFVETLRMQPITVEEG